tara:strand:- start:1014 stop:1637 length:624 start_codon:yes stop_codon:yes gene_type:complete
MGATSIRSRITDLLKELTVDSTAIGQFATDSAKEIINMLPQSLLWTVSKETVDESGNGAAVTSGRIISVTRNGHSAREGNPADSEKFKSSDSMHFATDESPVFYRKNKKIYIVPVHASHCKVMHVEYPTITYDQDLSSFVGAPEEIEHLIILKTAIKARINELNDFQDDSEEHTMKMQDLQLLQQEYAQAVSIFVGNAATPEERGQE